MILHVPLDIVWYALTVSSSSQLPAAAAVLAWCFWLQLPSRIQPPDACSTESGVMASLSDVLYDIHVMQKAYW